MNVLHLLSSTGYHGAEHMAAELIRRLASLGVTNYLAVFDSGPRSNVEILRVAKPHVADGATLPCRGRLDVRTVRLIRRYAGTRGIDVVHSHGYKSNIYALAASLGAPWKLVSTCHNWLGESRAMRLYARLDKLVLRGFDAVAGVSEDVTRELLAHVDGRKVRKIENGVDMLKFGTPLDKSQAKKQMGFDERPLVGFVGRLSRGKGVSDLLRAVRMLLAEGLDFHTLIVGSGEREEALKAEVRDLGLGDSVTFTGNRDDTPLIYAALDVFVLPSMKEAFPLVVLEAMAAGAPIVATTVGDVPRMIEHDVSGLLTGPGDAASLGLAVRTLLLDRDKAEHLGRAAHAAAAKHYASTRMAERYLEMYRQVANRS